MHGKRLRGKEVRLRKLIVTLSSTKFATRSFVAPKHEYSQSNFFLSSSPPPLFHRSNQPRRRRHVIPDLTLNVFQCHSLDAAHNFDLGIPMDFGDARCSSGLTFPHPTSDFPLRVS